MIIGTANCVWIWLCFLRGPSVINLNCLDGLVLSLIVHIRNYLILLHDSLSYPSIAGPWVFDESPLFCFFLPNLQENLNHVKNLELDTWLDLAAIYIKLSRWHDAELCLSKSEAISAFSASRWHATGNHALVFYSYQNPYWLTIHLLLNHTYGKTLYRRRT